MSPEEGRFVWALSCAATGRRGEAVTALAELEAKTGARMRDFMSAARALFEGRIVESLATVQRIAASNFRDPEGLYYLTRHLAHLKQKDGAVNLFRRVVGGG